MKLSFLPGDLHLNKEQDGSYVVSMQNVEILRTKVEKRAVTKFNVLRRELEDQYPTRELTPEEKLAALARCIGDHKFSQIRKEMKPVKRDKPSGTRTFR